MGAACARFVLVAAAALGSAVACGARGDIASSELYEAGGSATADGRAGDGDGSNPADASRPGSSGGDSTPLGDCTRGFAPGTAGRGGCDWLGSDGLCYSTRQAACACVCPRTRDSVCRSGFPNGPDGRTSVYCD